MLEVNSVEEWLGEDNKIGIDIWKRKYRYNNESFSEWLDRVSGGNPDLRELIKNKKFLFGGRVLANRGIEGGGNFYNCFSNGYVPDSMSGIMDVAKTLAITYKIQGGQGISLSKIRPKGTKIGTEYISDGIVPFMRIFNTVTDGISQGGARKGALMMSLDIRHKEAGTFITLKSKDNEIERANLSLEIDNRFMKAVETFYKTGEIITLQETRTYGLETITYNIIPIDLYLLMMENVYDWGEPGCLFTKRFRDYNLMEKIDKYEIVTSNPLT